MSLARARGSESNMCVIPKCRWLTRAVLKQAPSTDGRSYLLAQYITHGARGAKPYLHWIWAAHHETL